MEVSELGPNQWRVQQRLCHGQTLIMSIGEPTRDGKIDVVCIGYKPMRARLKIHQ